MDSLPHLRQSPDTLRAAVELTRVATAVIVTLTVALLLAASLLWTPDKPRPVLEARYRIDPSDYLDVAGIRLHVRDSGLKQHPAIIMLHGFGSSLQTWDSWSQVLSQAFRVIRIDLPGSALTGADPTDDYSDARCIEILVALMDKLQVPRASLIGNSIGGRIAWEFAATEPDRVASLVLISPDGFASPGFEYGRKPHVPAPLRLLKYVLPKWVLRMNLAQSYGDPANLADDVVSRYYDLLLAPGVRGAMIDRLAQTVLVDPVPILVRIRAPTLILWGEKDALIPISNSDDYLRSIPQSTLVRLPGLGHVPQEEAPLIALAPVSSFLARNSTPP